jgi:signal transduction histidine kinase
LLQHLGNLLRVVRFWQKPSDLGQIFFPDIHKARCRDDLDRWPAAAGGVGELPPVHRTWHLYVGKNNADVAAGLENCDGFVGVAGLHHLEARLCDHDGRIHSRQQLGERETSELHEQFIAVLGHDLRNPLASMAAGTQLLTRGGREPAPILALMQQSVARMLSLIDNLLDFARGRLVSGITLDRSPHALAPVLDHVIAELRSTYPDRPIEVACKLGRPVDCDSGRVAQLFSNLLGNALTHGSADSPVSVRATANDREFVLSIANAGTPIPQEAIERLFQPFYRASQDPGQGLGLGLYIASEIARAHGGRIDVTSSPQETRFTFRMPA